MANDIEIIKNVAQVAGIGGISIGALIIIFKDIIGKEIFPDLGKKDAFSLLRTMVLAAWSIAVIGILSWVYIDTNPPKSGEQRVEEIQSKLNSQSQALSQISSRLNVAENEPSNLVEVKLELKNEIDVQQKILDDLKNERIRLQNEALELSKKTLDELEKKIAIRQSNLDAIIAKINENVVLTQPTPPITDVVPEIIPDVRNELVDENKKSDQGKHETDSNTPPANLPTANGQEENITAVQNDSTNKNK